MVQVNPSEIGGVGTKYVPWCSTPYIHRKHVYPVTAHEFVVDQCSATINLITTYPG